MPIEKKRIEKDKYTVSNVRRAGKDINEMRKKNNSTGGVGSDGLESIGRSTSKEMNCITESHSAFGSMNVVVVVDMDLLVVVVVVVVDSDFESV